PPPPTIVGAPEPGTPAQPPPPTIVGAPEPLQPGVPRPTVVDPPAGGVTHTTIDRPGIAGPQPLGIPQCSEEGNTTHCPSGTVCAIGTDQVLGCRKICQSDADCESGQACIPTPRVNRNICLVR
ncbi:MAG: hypothetical protein JXB32_06560, partial [Deltaproteobacteria bacterium]|nr:hypothetical protein [Deltaproteobacteria bacterium]